MNKIKYYSSAAFQNATAETFDSDLEEQGLLVLKGRTQTIMLIFSSIYFINASKHHCDQTSNYGKQSILIITTHNTNTRNMH